MRYTSKGYKVPELGDKDFWDSIEFDIERLDGHDHDGINSQRLSPGAIGPYAENILVADWVGASVPYYYDFIFPLSWDMLWDAADPCPVVVTARDTTGNIVYLDQEPAPSGLGVRLSTSVKLDIVLGVT